MKKLTKLIAILLMIGATIAQTAFAESWICWGFGGTGDLVTVQVTKLAQHPGRLEL